MPLFGSKNDPSPPPASKRSSVDSPRRGGTLFGRRSEEVPDTASTTSGNSRRRSLLHKEDNSITTARERVLGAEAAEKEADKALVAARLAVKEAREHVKRLEREAAEEARLAKIKQNQAKSISDRAKPLGRHNH